MIEVVNLWKSYGKTEVLRETDFKVEDGEVFGVVGINGSGKSTLLRLMSGVLRPDEGEIRYDGEPVYENERVKKNLFFLSDDPFYTMTLTANQQAAFYKNFYSFDDEVFRTFTDKFSLDRNKPIRNFSKGMKRQTFVSLALACRPKYLLLDESFDGLDPLARLEFKRGIVELQQNGATVVIASHSLRELEDICDSFALVDGRTVKVYGKIENELSKLKKYQLVFETELERDDFPFDCLRYEKTGRVHKIVVRGDAEKIRAQIDEMHPLIVDEIPMDFEDLFLNEVEQRGYAE